MPANVVVGPDRFQRLPHHDQTLARYFPQKVIASFRYPVGAPGTNPPTEVEPLDLTSKNCWIGVELSWKCLCDATSRHLILTYFRRLCAPTSAANTEPMLSAAIPEADVPRITLSKSAGSGMKALSEPLIASPMVMPRSSPFFADESGNEAPT